MSPTRDTRLIDLFDFPDRVFAVCARRRVRTVGEVLALTGEADVRDAAFALFFGWCQWDHQQDCRDAAAVITEIAGRPRPKPAGVTG